MKPKLKTEEADEVTKVQKDPGNENGPKPAPDSSQIEEIKKTEVSDSEKILEQMSHADGTDAVLHEEHHKQSLGFDESAKRDT